MIEMITMIISGSALAGLIVYVVKILIAKAIDAGVVNYKYRLDKELEVTKHNLDLLKIQYQIQFSSLSEKRGEFIALLHSKFYDLQTQLEEYTKIINNTSFSEIGESDEQLIELHKDTIVLFEKHRIYLEDEHCQMIENNLKDIKTVIEKMILAKNAKKWPSSDVNLDVGEGQLPEEIWQEQYHKVKQDINYNRLTLAKQFRQIISPPTQKSQILNHK